MSALDPLEECLKWNRWDLVALETALDLTPGRNVAVQAGGNLGVFANRLSEVFDAVYTFEPDALLFPMLVANAPQENIVRFQAALGEQAGFVGTKRTTDKGTHAGVTHVSGPGIIPTMVLDDLRLPACDLLYLDIEGYELNALRGADYTVARHRPTIAVEINKCIERYGQTRAELESWLTGHGYVERAHVHADHIWTWGA